jgi:hypothetical protein
MVLGVLAACAAPQPASVEQPTLLPPSIFKIADGGVGPIDASTRANLTAVREIVGPQGYTVRPINDGGVELHVYDGKEHLFYVIPSDDGSLFNVHVVSGSIPITQHPEWVIGQPFVHSELLTFCEPWGPHPVCWRKGDHVALGFKIGSDDLDTAEQRKSLEGTPIQRAVWSPKPFGDEDDDDDSDGGIPSWIPRNDS